jgi:hypothetical protein
VFPVRYKPNPYTVIRGNFIFKGLSHLFQLIVEVIGKVWMYRFTSS